MDEDYDGQSAGDYADDDAISGAHALYAQATRHGSAGPALPSGPSLPPLSGPPPPPGPWSAAGPFRPSPSMMPSSYRPPVGDYRSVSQPAHLGSNSNLSWPDSGYSSYGSFAPPVPPPLTSFGYPPPFRPYGTVDHHASPTSATSPSAMAFGGPPQPPPPPQLPLAGSSGSGIGNSATSSAQGTDYYGGNSQGQQNVVPSFPGPQSGMPPFSSQSYASPYSTHSPAYSSQNYDDGTYRPYNAVSAPSPATGFPPPQQHQHSPYHHAGSPAHAPPQPQSPSVTLPPIVQDTTSKTIASPSAATPPITAAPETPATTAGGNDSKSVAGDPKTPKTPLMDPELLEQVKACFLFQASKVLPGLMDVLERFFTMILPYMPPLHRRFFFDSMSALPRYTAFVSLGMVVWRTPMLERVINRTCLSFLFGPRSNSLTAYPSLRPSTMSVPLASKLSYFMTGAVKSWSPLLAVPWAPDWRACLALPSATFCSCCAA